MISFHLWQVIGPGELKQFTCRLKEDGSNLQIIDEHDRVIQEGDENCRIVKLMHCGLCSTDIASLNGLFSFPLPLTIGHEIIGCHLTK